MFKFEQIGGPLCLDFTNTMHYYGHEGAQDDLTDFAALVEWNRQWGAISAREAGDFIKQAAKRSSEAEETFQRAIRLRAATYQIVLATIEGRAPQTQHLAELNQILAEGLGHLRVSVTADRQFVWTWDKNEEKLDRILWPIARSAAELLISGDGNRLRQCGGERCTWFFLDMSKNQTRRWCNMADCGNRAKARRYYERTHK